MPPHHTVDELVLPRRINYRPDIDGLRAIAVLSVIGFHAFPKWLTGGFVGVDIFFVISGYLISSLILKSLETDSFSFIDFYFRRAKRIFPALAVVLSTVYAFGWLTLLKPDFSQLGKHIIAGSAFVSNVALFREVGYFDQNANLKPLLHLWSLGIEEQFYFAWPLLIFAGHRMRWNLFLLIGVIAAGSFYLNVSLVRHNEAASFYLPTSRAWELALGALLACRHIYAWPTSSWLHVASSFFGALLLFTGVLFTDQSKLFPGWWALLPTVGACLIIAAGKNTWLNATVLSSPPMTFIGKISYSLYLWHWPLISFLRIVTVGEPSTVAKIVTIFAAFILAWMTYRFIERPARALQFRPSIFASLTATMAATACLGALTYLHLFLPRSANYQLDQYIEATTTLAYPGPQLIPIGTHEKPLFSQNAGSKTVLFMGDSNIEQYYPRVNLLLNRNSRQARSVVYASLGGCPPLPDVREDHHPYCDGIVKSAVAYADSDPRVDTVVISANWMGYFPDANIDKDHPFTYYLDGSKTRDLLTVGSADSEVVLLKFRDMLQHFVAHKKRVFLILQIPTGHDVDPHRMLRRNWHDLSFSLEPITLDKTALVNQWRPVMMRLRKIANETGATTIDPLDWLCDEVHCPTVTQSGMPMYRDEHHLNPIFVRENVRYLDEALWIDK